MQARFLQYWLSAGGREFGVYVQLLVDMKRHRVIRSFTEKTDGMLPAYGKWRQAAVAAVRKRYGAVTIVDYQPCRCDAIRSGAASQTFKFWIEQDQTWKFVYVTITYDLPDGQIRSIAFQEKREPR